MACPVQSRSGMQPHVPRSYDQITRSTVVDPDGSLRPPAGEPRLPDPALWECVRDVLTELGVQVGFEVADRDVILRGQVRDRAASLRIERAVAAIDGVERVWNHLDVG